MHIGKILVPLGLVLLLAACGPFESLNPLYTREDLVFEPALLGSWIGGEQDSLKLTFQESEGTAYKLIETGIDEDTHSPAQVKYEAHLARLGEFLFLDVVPEEIPFELRLRSYKFKLIKPKARNETQITFEPHLLRVDALFYLDLVPSEPREEGNSEGDSYELHLIPAHWFFKVSLDGDDLSLAYIDDDWLSRTITEEEVSIDHDGDVVTAGTKDLQEFIIEHSEDEEAFSDRLDWRRQKRG